MTIDKTIDQLRRKHLEYGEPTQIIGSHENAQYPTLMEYSLKNVDLIKQKLKEHQEKHEKSFVIL